MFPKKTNFFRVFALFFLITLSAFCIDSENSTSFLTPKLPQPATSSIELINKGALLLSQGKLIEAENVLSKACDENQNSPEAFYNLGLTLSFEGDFTNASKNFTKAINLKPEFPAANLALGVAYISNGETEKALDAFSKCYQQSDPFSENGKSAFFNRGIALGRLKRFSEAELCFSELLAQNPDDPFPAFEIGKLKMQQGKNVQALEWLDAAKTALPLEVSILKGKIQLKMGKKAEANKSLEEAKQLLQRSNFSQEVCKDIASEVENLLLQSQ
ncbi:MAG: tetratricopeptide repeat protein [Candidatus Riflebacteria bacterium]|nr:tetratricopeptide repeat protein [Candidatus Riflebacteria bacterium]